MALNRQDLLTANMIRSGYRPEAAQLLAEIACAPRVAPSALENVNGK